MTVHMSREQTGACILAFIAGLSSMVVEIVAGRILAPHVGVSLYTWTSIIGVVLAGIALGAYLGGLIADRYGRRSTLGWIFVLSGLAVLFIPPLTGRLGAALVSGPLMARVLFVTTVVFLVPSLFLGMALPVVVKSALSTISGTGNVVGKIYAFSTLGSILGTFATGFFLISWLGTENLLFAVAVLLFVSAFLLGGFAGKRRLAFVVLLLPLAWLIHYGLFRPAADPDTIVTKESDYYRISVKQTTGNNGQQLRTLYLDQLTHSCSDPKDPAYLQFRYIRSYREIVGWKAKGRGSLNSLFVGGGGYTFPRFMEAAYQNAAIDVVEIDPLVSRVSREYMGLAPGTKIRTFNEDARWFVMNRKNEGVYDFIFMDAFNDLSIPYHLTTKEFVRELKSLLASDGLLLANVIDRFEKGSFLPAYIKTLEEVFGRGNVHLVTLGRVEGSRGVENRVVLASPRGIDATSLTGSLDKIDEIERISYVMSQEDLRKRLDEFQPMVLTDDYAPVDNLTAANFH